MLDQKTHFLIVDDYSNIRTLVKGQLTEFGIQKITEAENVDTAITLLEASTNSECPIKFIISDWNMPGKSGLDFLKWVRTNDQFKNLPFLILTTENEKDKIMSAIQSGVSNFLLKPWEDEELIDKIKLCASKHSK